MYALCTSCRVGEAVGWTSHNWFFKINPSLHIQQVIEPVALSHCAQFGGKFDIDSYSQRLFKLNPELHT